MAREVPVLQHAFDVQRLGGNGLVFVRQLPRCFVLPVLAGIAHALMGDSHPGRLRLKDASRPGPRGARVYGAHTKAAAAHDLSHGETLPLPTLYLLRQYRHLEEHHDHIY